MRRLRCRSSWPASASFRSAFARHSVDVRNNICHPDSPCPAAPPATSPSTTIVFLSAGRRADANVRQPDLGQPETVDARHEILEVLQSYGLFEVTVRRELVALGD